MRHQRAEQRRRTRPLRTHHDEASAAYAAAPSPGRRRSPTCRPACLTLSGGKTFRQGLHDVDYLHACSGEVGDSASTRSSGDAAPESGSSPASWRYRAQIAEQVAAGDPGSVGRGQLRWPPGPLRPRAASAVHAMADRSPSGKRRPGCGSARRRDRPGHRRRTAPSPRPRASRRRHAPCSKARSHRASNRRPAGGPRRRGEHAVGARRRRRSPPSRRRVTAHTAGSEPAVAQVSRRDTCQRARSRPSRRAADVTGACRRWPDGRASWTRIGMPFHSPWWSTRRRPEGRCRDRRQAVLSAGASVLSKLAGQLGQPQLARTRSGDPTRRTIWMTGLRLARGGPSSTPMRDCARPAPRRGRPRCRRGRVARRDARAEADRRRRHRWPRRQASQTTRSAQPTTVPDEHPVRPGDIASGR